MPIASPLPLDEQDFEEVDKLLESLGAEDGLRLDGAQGLLTALIVGPQDVGPEDWLPVILGGEPLGAPSPKLQRLLDLLLRLQASLAHGLDMHSYDPIFAEHEGDDDERAVDAGGWCEGFSLGVDLNAEIWEQRMQEDRTLLEMLAPIVALAVDAGGWCEGFSLGVDLNAEIWEQRMQEDRTLLEMLAPIVALGVDDGVFAEIRNPDQAPLSERERDIVVAQLASVLIDVRQYWQEHPPETSAPVGATLH